MTDQADTPVCEHRSRRRANLQRMLKPKSLVMVGGSAMSFAIEYVRTLGFDGNVHVVNPFRDEIAGVPCLPDIRALPEVPDAAWIGVPTDNVIDVVRDLNNFGVPAAVCFTAGFGEVGARELERALVEAAGDMALLGPNCMGFINFLDGVGLVASTHGVTRPERGIACIAQSGTIVANMVTSDRSVPISHLLSMGNQAVLDLADGIAAVIDDERVKAVMLYIEGIKDAHAFAQVAAHAFDLGKPIVCLKGGVSDAGAAIALSHTGSLAGRPEFYDAFFKRLGIINVKTFPELLELSKLLAFDGLPRGNRVMIETCSGTDSGYCADLAERYGVDLPQPSASVKAQLREVLPPIATPMNPLDVTMMQWGDREAQATSLITLLNEPADAAALVLNLPPYLDTTTYRPALEAMKDVRAEVDLPCYVIANLPEGAPIAAREELLEAGVIPLQGIEDAFSCIGRGARYTCHREFLTAQGGPETRLLCAPVSESSTLLDEAQAKQALAAYGVPVPAYKLAGSAEQAADIAAAHDGPVVVKGCGTELAHKSELGAVAVNLTESSDIVRVAAAMLVLPGVSSLLVEPMVTDAVAEFIVGIKRDSLFGLALVLGTGGVLTELVRDTTHVILPASRGQIESAVECLSGAALLEGFRGAPAGDKAALCDLIEKVCDYASAEADRLIELDVNPVMVRPQGKGVVAVDALIRQGV